MPYINEESLGIPETEYAADSIVRHGEHWITIRIDASPDARRTKFMRIAPEYCRIPPRAVEAADQHAEHLLCSATTCGVMGVDGWEFHDTFVDPEPYIVYHENGRPTYLLKVGYFGEEPPQSNESDFRRPVCLIQVVQGVKGAQFSAETLDGKKPIQHVVQHFLRACGILLNGGWDIYINTYSNKPRRFNNHYVRDRYFAKKNREAQLVSLDARDHVHLEIIHPLCQHRNAVQQLLKT